MSRDEFEEWLEDHRDEALARVEGERFSLRKWIGLFNQGLIVESGASGDEDESDEEEDLFGVGG